MPTWSTPARKRAKEITASVDAEVRGIADCLADFDQRQRAARAHVDRAFSYLANAGLSRRRWINRPDTETGLGGAIIGLSFSAPDVVNTLIDGSADPGAAPACLISLFVIGAFFAGRGMYRARLPQAPIVSTTVERLGKAVLIITAAAVVAGIIFLSARYFLEQLPAR